MTLTNRYNFKTVESKWQKNWEEKKTFLTKVDKSTIYEFSIDKKSSGETFYGQERVLSEANQG